MPELIDACMDGDGSPPSCTVVIATRDRPEYLSRCLDAVTKQSYPAFDVLVVDNGSSGDATLQTAQQWGVRHVSEPVAGLSRARNRGARESDKEIVAYLDDDAVPQPGWLEALGREFRDQRVIAVTGRVIPLEESDSSAGTGVVLGTCQRQTRVVLDRDNPHWFEWANFGGVGIGANMAMRRSAFATWPGFDTRLGRGAAISGGEENYAFFALVERGYRLVYTPDAIVRHRTAKTSEESYTAHLRSLAIISAYVIFLFAEHPQYRARLLRYVLGGVRGSTRAWRERHAATEPAAAPRWRQAIAWMSGPWLYARSRLIA